MTERRGIIFDLDGVLVDSAELHYQAWQRLADREGIVFGREDNERLKGVSRMASLDIILEKAARPYTDAQKQALAAAKNDDYRALIDTLTEDDLLPGSRQVLEMCRLAGMKIALGSASRNGPAVLDRLQIRHYFDYLVDPGALPGKPAPDIFLDGARGLGLSPADCAGVEDAVAGVQAIKAAGMPAIGIGDPRTLKGADLVLPDLSDFRLDLIP